ncbi:hypothetical protein BDW72DRAFT_180057 [Aspergillus terricola var. indicus]
MYPYASPWVLTAALVLVYLTQSTNATTVSLLDLLPKCASQCLEDFISTEYPRGACSEGCDLNYLCTTDTTSGYTLGEAGLRCSLSKCSMEVALSFDTYSICDDVPGALPRTHPTIVATITSPANPTSTVRPTTVITTEPETTDTPTTIRPVSTETANTSTSLTTTQSQTSSSESTEHPETETDKPTATTTTTTTTTGSSPSATSSEASNEPGQGSNLNSGAVIGVSVASGIAGFFIIGVIIFFCCRKIRRKAQDREFFEIGGHMTEPPDFSFPPKRPPMGPRPSPKKLFGTDSESVRLVSPADAEYQDPAQYPAVVVTQPEEDYEYGRMSAMNTARAGFQSTSNLDFDAESTVSSRTVSDLLPDKPTYELYPRPLRWSQHKKARPFSGATVFEQNHARPARPRRPPSPPLQKSGLAPGNASGHNRHLIAGLPANPRAMMYGFGSPGLTAPRKGFKHEKRPVYASSNEQAQPSRQTAVHGTSPYPPGHSRVDYDDDLDNYWKNSSAGFVGAKMIQPQHQPQSQDSSTARGAAANRNSVSDYPGYQFEFGFGHGSSSSGSRRASRQSGSFRPLTPVRETRTPLREMQNPTGGSSKRGNSSTARDLAATKSSGPSPRPLPGPPDPSHPPQEIVSRPRIVRQDDIKRVQIRRGKPLPSPEDSEVTVPYSPDDFWFAPKDEPSSASAYIIPPPRSSTDYKKYTSKGQLGMPKKKPLPPERNLTPSRRGEDLILQVE